MLFLRNEFSKIFEEIPTMTLFTAMTYINEQISVSFRQREGYGIRKFENPLFLGPI